MCEGEVQELTFRRWSMMLKKLKSPPGGVQWVVMYPPLSVCATLNVVRRFLRIVASSLRFETR